MFADDNVVIIKINIHEIISYFCRVSLNFQLKVMLLCPPKRRRCPILECSQSNPVLLSWFLFLFVKILFDGHLSNIIVFSYNAKAVDGQLCLEASPNENQTFFAHSPHATMLEVHIYACTGDLTYVYS